MGTLRGGIPIALSLTLPEFNGKDVIITMTYGCCLDHHLPRINIAGTN